MMRRQIGDAYCGLPDIRIGIRGGRVGGIYLFRTLEYFIVPIEIYMLQKTTLFFTINHVER